ncbi:MAG: [Fe-Fe] hydrogenase large subunit C-terminal domain-containing protein [Bacteroidota bacterium]
MENEPLLKINNKTCTICYACVRACPVKAIEVKVNQDYPKIVHERCIACGSCLSVCAPEAIIVRDSKEQVKNILKSGKKVAAICAPSISGEFVDITDYRKFVEMIRALGFSYVNEVSFGVDLVAKEYNKLITNSNGKYYITSSCPAVSMLVEKYHPDLISNLAPIVTPMVSTTKVVRKLYGDDISVVYICPCIASKEEILRSTNESKVDAVLTFVELRALFAEHNINENAFEFSDFDAPHGNKGGLYAISSGLMEAAELDQSLMNGEIITTDGRGNTIAAIKEFEKHIDTIKHHFCVFYCGGCLMGPGTSRGGERFKRKAVVIDFARKRLAGLDIKKWEKNIKSFEELDLSRKFFNDDQRISMPDEEAIQEVLKVIGKEVNYNNVGCEACGFTSCREFAVSVAKGIAKPEMCISYSLKSKQDYIKTLKVTNQKLAETKEALRKSEENARKEQQIAKEALDRTSMMLQKLTAGVVIIDEKLKIIEANKSFITMLGDEAREIDEIIPGLVGADVKMLLPYNFYNLFSYVLETDENILNRDIHLDDKLFNVSIFTLKKNKIVGAVIRDMFQPEVQKEEIINRVTDVIDKNLELVQKIGFILGEGAAETEKMLNSIIQSYQNPKKS